MEFDWLAQDGKNVWCKVCKAHKSLAASDAIGTGTAEFGSVRKDKITGHADIRTHTGMRHMLCQVEADKKKQAQQVGTSAAALRGKLGKHLTFTQKDVIIDRLFTIVYALAKKHIAMNAMSDICDMVRACDAVIGNGDYTSSTSVWGMVEVMADYYRDEQKKRISLSVYFSLLSDGSTGRNVVESEVIYVRYHNVVTQEMCTEFFQLQPLDRSKSADGKSFDAACIVAAFERAMQERLPGWWAELASHLIATSFDGASVMMGSKQGVVALLIALVPHLICIHAVAHNLQLAGQDAWDVFPFMDTLNQILKDCYAYYHVSAKRAGSLADVALGLEQAALKFSKMHGIRWMAAQKRATQVLLHNWYAVVSDLDEIANESIGLNFTEMSSVTAFVEAKVQVSSLMLSLCLLRISLHLPLTATPTLPLVCVSLTIMCVMQCYELFPSVRNAEVMSRYLGKAWKVDPEDEERILMRYSDQSTLPKTKGQLISLMQHDRHELLAPLHEYQLSERLCDYRSLKSFHLLCDINSELSTLSLVFQSRKLHGHELCFSDCIIAIESCIDRLHAMETEMPTTVGIFEEAWDETTEIFRHWDAQSKTYTRGKPLLDVTKGKEAFDSDRVLWIGELIVNLQDRFDAWLCAFYLLLIDELIVL